MPGRTNAASELTRFWLQARHNCLVDESISVPVKIGKSGGNSDIDLVAIHPNLRAFTLPSGVHVGPRLIVETKDEHDWEPTGAEFGTLLQADAHLMCNLPFIPKGTKGVKFSMLRQEHYEKACDLFGTDDFDRLFVVHAIHPELLATVQHQLAEARVHWLTIPQLLADLLPWYATHKHPTELRQSLVGDLLHLLVGFCHLTVQSPAS